jgi:hypothetical protein
MDLRRCLTNVTLSCDFKVANYNVSVNLAMHTQPFTMFFSSLLVRRAGILTSLSISMTRDNKEQKKVTQLLYYAFHFHPFPIHMDYNIFHGGRLFQQHMVDA